MRKSKFVSRILYYRGSSCHLSSYAITSILLQSTHFACYMAYWRATSGVNQQSLFDFSIHEVYPATQIAPSTGRLLPYLFTLTLKRRR